MPLLIVFSGMLGVGKTMLAKAGGGKLGDCFLRNDKIEHALRDLAQVSAEGEGYIMAYLLAADSLACGVTVVADCCNPVLLIRREWRDIAMQFGALIQNIEITSSNSAEHVRTAQKSDIPTLMD